MDDILTLKKATIEKDEYGVERATYDSADVFCMVRSVTRSEFFGGGRSGLNPAFVFSVFRGDYRGEEVCEFRGRSYSIYRTYLREDNDYIELYVERQGGTNGKT